MAHQSELISEDINAYLKQHEHKELLRLLTCGSVDDGKSTLIGRLLHDSHMIYEDQLEAIKSDSVKSGTQEGEIDLALLVDGLQAEREQGITIDVAYRFFSTARRKFIIADTPGHEQYTRNMATGASTADLAIILIDARHGVLTQTKRHSFIASLLGIKHVVVAVNKMDLVDYSQERFESIKKDYLDFAAQLNLHDIQCIPISALKGDNVVSVADEMSWFTGQPLMEILETVAISGDRNLDNFRLPVQYVNRPNLNFRGFCGTVASGTIKPGERVTALPSGKTSTVKSVINYEGEMEEAFADQAITLTLNDEIDVSRGDMLVKHDNLPHSQPAFSAHIVWMAERTLKPGQLLNFKIGSLQVSGSVKSIEHVVDVNTMEKSHAEELGLNSISKCDVHVNQSVVFDAYDDNKNTGAFIIIDRLTNATLGAGMIIDAIDVSGVSDWQPVSESEKLDRYDQEPKILIAQGEAADVLAEALERKLFDQGHIAVKLSHPDLDGNARLNSASDILRAGLFAIISDPDADIDTNEGQCFIADTDNEIAPAIALLK